jgi:hypothetical protein
VLLGAAVLVFTLGRDAGGKPTPTSTTSRAQHLAQLRAEAEQAAQTYFQRKDGAEAVGDPSKLEGIFTPNNVLQAALAKRIDERRRRGEVQVTESRTEQIEILSLDEAQAQVRFVNVTTKASINDIATGRVKERFELGQGTWLLYLRRVGGRWLVDGLDDVRDRQAPGLRRSVPR